ncbi:MAG: PAS domain S-box protein, partial [Verrucomicrobiota bacterium]
MNTKGTILVVDDTPANLQLLVDTLTAEGYQVLPADSGELALAAVAARPPELILLDIRMPGMDGLEFYRRLAAKAESRGIPIIFFSAVGEGAERVAGLKLGAVDFIAKPIQQDELLARVQTQLELHRLRGRAEHLVAELQCANEQIRRELAERERSEAAALLLAREIQGSHQATLNLMDDAVEAKKHLEIANRDLQNEIVERQRAEVALSLKSAALEAAANGIIITDRAGLIEWANPAFAELTGFSLAEVIGRNPGELVKSGQHAPAFYRGMWAAILAGKVWRGEIVNRRKDGRPIVEEMTITPVCATSGGITHFIAIKQDISARRSAERKIRDQAALLDHANDAIYVHTMDGTISYWNVGAEHLYGWTAAEVIGRRCVELNLSDVDQRAELNATLTRTGGWTGEKQQIARD